MTLDLDKLEALVAEMTPGPWLAPRAVDHDPDNPGALRDHLTATTQEPTR